MQTLWSRIPSNSSIWKNETDPSAGKNAPHLELYFSVRHISLEGFSFDSMLIGFCSPQGGGPVAGAAIILLTPKSRTFISRAYDALC
jgi:hypothetical protein